MKDISIGIVTYNNEDEIVCLLDSILKYTEGVTFQIYVIDNMSQDNTAAVVEKNYPEVTVIRNNINGGYGHGHNKLLKGLDSRYHAIVNPDIELRENTFKKLADYMDSHSDVAMVTPKILNEDGTEQKLPKKRPTPRYMFGGRLSRFGGPFKKIRDEYTMGDRSVKEPTEIEFCTGCFMFMRTDVWVRCGGFDEQFFMYMEDADLSDRVGEYGKIVFNPQVNAVHKWEHASGKSMKFLMIHLSSMRKYLKKRKKSKV